MRRRLDVAFIALNTLAGTGTGVDAILATSSPAHRAILGAVTAVTLGSALGLTIRGRRESARTEARINYLQNTPEAYREWDRQCTSWGVTTHAASEFNTNFGFHGNGRNIIAHCRLCANYETHGGLGDVMAAGVEHLRAKHKLAA
jgi:hypothetical protein